MYERLIDCSRTNHSWHTKRIFPENEEKMMNKVNLLNKLNLFDEYWMPKIVGESKYNSTWNEVAITLPIFNNNSKFAFKGCQS